MNVETLQQYWALLAAAVVAGGVVVFVILRLAQDSSRGRLAAEVGQLRKREKAARKAARATGRARKRLARLQVRAETVKPRHVDEARERLLDAEAFQKIVDDQVLVARNRVRTIIVEEYPPKRQESLRQRLLPETPAENGPFSMSA